MITMSKSMRRWYPVKLNFLDTTKCPIDSNSGGGGEEYKFENLDLKKISQSKKKETYTKTFTQILEDLAKSSSQFKHKLEDLKHEESDDPEADTHDLLDDNENKNLDTKETIPLQIKIQSKCLTMCIHLIAHPFKQIRLQIIELIGELSHNLAEYPNELLPLVHRLWSSLCQRFSYDDLIIKSKIVHLLFDLSVLCGDFLSARFSKEFLPRLCAFMSEQAKLSGQLTSSDSAAYVYSHAFKLQASILSNIAQMSIFLEIKETQLEILIDSIILKYLDERQPIKLQKLAMSAIRNCALIDADVLWLCLHYVMPFGKIGGSNLDFSTSVKLKYDFKVNDDMLLDLIGLYSQL
jgi:hypothetical protein